MVNTDKIRQDIKNIISERSLAGGGKKKKDKHVKGTNSKTVKKPYKKSDHKKVPKKVPVGYKCNLSIVNGIAKQKCTKVYDNKKIQNEIREIDARFKELMKNFARF